MQAAGVERRFNAPVRSSARVSGVWVSVEAKQSVAIAPANIARFCCLDARGGRGISGLGVPSSSSVDIPKFAALPGVLDAVRFVVLVLGASEPNEQAAER